MERELSRITTSEGLKKSKGILILDAAKTNNIKKLTRDISNNNLLRRNHLIVFLSFFIIKSKDGKSIFLSFFLDIKCIMMGTTTRGKRKRKAGKLMIVFFSFQGTL
jgi:hypothetical protein